MGELDRDLASLICSPSLLQTFSDTDLMDALRRGCNDALAVLFERHSTLVFRVARAILRDDGEAEETVQRVFLDVYRAANQFKTERGTFITWLRQYAYHRSLDRRAHLRANHFYTNHELNDTVLGGVFQGTGNLPCSTPQEMALLVEQMLATLAARQRRVIELT